MGRFALVSVLAMFLFSPSGAQAGGAKTPYSPQAVDSAMAKGCTVFLEFGAKW